MFPQNPKQECLIKGYKSISEARLLIEDSA